MGFRILESGKELASAQRALISAFRDARAEEKTMNIGYHGGNHNLPAYWLPQYNLWLACATGRPPSGRKGSERYWNVFGTPDPATSTSHSIVCEINIPLSGIDRRIAGAIVSDAAGDMFLAHRGMIGGGKPGAGMSHFWKHYGGEALLVQDGDRTTRVALIGKFGSSQFLSQLKYFVHAVAEIKKML